MPRFLFHIHYGTEQPDLDGTELRDFGEAWSQAVTTAGETLCDLDGALLPSTTWTMRVVDERGAELCSLRISAGSESADGTSAQNGAATA